MLPLLMLGFISLIACTTDDDSPTSELTDIDVSVISVPRNTAFQALDLPETVTLLNNNNEQIRVPVDWSNAESDYDQTQSLITLEGEFTDRDTYMIADDLDPLITIRFTDVGLLNTLEGLEQFSIFYQAIIQADLGDIFTTDAQLTLFAPTNDAFQDLIALLDITEDALYDNENLNTILLNHIVVGMYPSTILRAAQPIDLTTLSSDALSVSLTGNTLNIDPLANLEDLDISATNGVIHSTNQVLLPPSLLNDITGDLFDNALIDSAIFDALFESFTDSGLISQLISGDPITLFLPNEDAFSTLASTYGITLDTLATSDIIIDILLYHMVDGDYLAEDLLLDAPLSLTSIEGSPLTITAEANTIYINDAQLLSTFNIQELGRVHDIDSVLLTAEMITALEALNE
jgi:uncharacterized surface protein with fasciclin (FAS1) repeats